MVVLAAEVAVESDPMHLAAGILTAELAAESIRMNLAAVVEKLEVAEDPEYRAAAMRWCQAMDL